MFIKERYNKNSKKIRRFTFRWILFLIVYGVVLQRLLIQHNIFTSIPFLLASLFILLFFVLDFDLFTKKQMRIGILLLLLLSFLVFIITAQLNINTILAYIFLNLAFFVLIWTKDFTVFSPWEYFTGGGYLFGFLVSLAYSCFILGTTEKFSLNCEKMYGSITEITEKIHQDSSFQWDEKSGSTLMLWENSPEINKKNISTTSATGSIWKEKKDQGVRWGIFSAGKEVLSDIGLSKKNIRDTRDEILVGINDLGNGVIDKWKNLWNEINLNRKALSLSACKYLGKQIWFLYKNTYFQLALVILMSLAFVGLIRLAAWIVTIVAYCLFRFLQLLWLYHITKKEKLVDTVE